MKINKLFLMFVMFFVGLMSVCALDNESKDIFLKDWAVDERYVEYPYDILEDESHVSYKGGFVTASQLDEGGFFYSTILTRYDVDGRVVKEKKLKDSTLLKVEEENGKLYGLLYSYSEVADDVNVNLVVYDENLSVLEQHFICNDQNNIAWSLYNSTIDFKWDGMDVITTDEKGNIYVLGYYYDYFVVVIDKSHSGVTFLYELDNVYKYFPFIKKLDDLSIEGDYYYSYVQEDSLEVVIGYDENDNDIIKLFEDEKEKWTKSFDEYDELWNSKIIDNYILVHAWTSKDDITVLLVLNFDGEILQTIESSYRIDHVTVGENNFMVFTSEGANGSVCDALVDGVDDINDTMGNKPSGSRRNIQSTMLSDNKYDCYKVQRQVWYLPSNIETKVNGEGTVDVVETSKYGEEVIFVVTPKEGYELGEVKVTDAKGNVLKFTDYKFTMPNADVLIEVSFIEKKNPDTSDIIFVALIVLAIATGVRYFLKKNEFKYSR